MSKIVEPLERLNANLEALLAELRMQGTPPSPTERHQPDDDPK